MLKFINCDSNEEPFRTLGLSALKSSGDGEILEADVSFFAHQLMIRENNALQPQTVGVQRIRRHCRLFYPLQ